MLTFISKSTNKDGLGNRGECNSYFMIHGVIKKGGYLLDFLTRRPSEQELKGTTWQVAEYSKPLLALEKDTGKRNFVMPSDYDRAYPSPTAPGISIPAVLTSRNIDSVPRLPSESPPFFMLRVWSPLSLGGPPAVAFGELGCVVHGFLPLYSFQRNCIPAGQIGVCRFTKPDLDLLSRAFSWVGSVAILFQRRAQAHNLRISS